MRSIALAVITLAGCAAALARPTAEDAVRAAQKWPEATLAELEHGRAVYVARCSSCHKLYLPHDEPADRWSEILDDMAPRAGLSAEEHQAVERFLVIMDAPGR